MSTDERKAVERWENEGGSVSPLGPEFLQGSTCGGRSK